MSKRNRRISGNLLFSIFFLLSMTITAWAGGPGEGISETEAATEASRVIMCGSGDDDASAQTVSVGEAPAEAEASTETKAALVVATGTKGASLGMFTTTGYCNCTKCSNGHNLTYSGTVPMAKRTISADLTKFPLGTKLMINNVVYTVEDMGSGVKGNRLDIYYDSHQEALTHGMKTEEVFAVSD